MYKEGDKVNWIYAPHAGTVMAARNIAGVVIGVTRQRVKVAIYNLKTKQVEIKNVSPNHVSAREEAHHSTPLDDFSLEELKPQCECLRPMTLHTPAHCWYCGGVVSTQKDDSREQMQND